MNAIPEPVTCDPVTGEPKRLPLDMNAASREADLLDLEIAAEALRRVRQRRGLTPDGAFMGIGDGVTSAEVAEIASVPGGKRTETINSESWEESGTAKVCGCRVIATRWRLLTAEERGRLRDAVLGQAAVR